MFIVRTEVTCHVCVVSGVAIFSIYWPAVCLQSAISVSSLYVFANNCHLCLQLRTSVTWGEPQIYLVGMELGSREGGGSVPSPVPRYKTKYQLAPIPTHSIRLYYRSLQIILADRDGGSWQRPKSRVQYRGIFISGSPTSCPDENYV